MKLINVGTLVVAGAIAQALAAPDKDIQAAKEAYEQQRPEDALQSLERARERRGDRPEIAFNFGLLQMGQDDNESAQKSFERASESEDASLRASARFELGNLAFDAEQWAVAIDHYIECLKEHPLHEDAKWNLELALTKQKQEQDEQKKKQDQDKQDQDNQDQENQDQEEQENQDEQEDQDEQESSSSSSSGGEDSEPDSGTQSEQDSQQDAGSSSGGDEGSSSQDDQGQDQSSTQQDQGQDSSEESKQGEDDQKPEDKPEEKPEDKKDDKQNAQKEQQEQGEPEQGAPNQPPPKSNLDRALEELDREDAFQFGRPPVGRRRRVKEDW